MGLQFHTYTQAAAIYKEKISLIMGKTVHSHPDVLHVCLTSDPSRKRPVLVVCEVKKNEPVGNTPDHDNSPPKKKTRSLNTAKPQNTIYT